MELCKVGKVKKVCKVSHARVGKTDSRDIESSVRDRSQYSELSTAVIQLGEVFKCKTEAPKGAGGISMNSTDYESNSNLKRFLEILPHKILDSENGIITEEDIYNIALNLRDKKKIPFYPRSIGPFEAYSDDICYCIEILKNVGFLDQVTHQLTASKKFAVNSYIWRNVDIDQIVCKKEILESCAAKIEDEPFEYERKNIINSYYLSILEKEYNYLFTHLGSLSSNSGAKADLKQIGIDSLKSLRSLEPKEESGKRGYEERILSKVGENILSHYDRLSPYNIRLSTIKNIYEKDKKKVEGAPICIIGIFSEYEKIPGNYLYKFLDSIVLGSNHRIRVIFRENGKFLSEKLALSEKECFLLGFVTSFREEVAIRAAGVVKINPEFGTIPTNITIPKSIHSQQAEPSYIIVKEKNGSETHIVGGENV